MISKSRIQPVDFGDSSYPRTWSTGKWDHVNYPVLIDKRRNPPQIVPELYQYFVEGQIRGIPASYPSFYGQSLIQYSQRGHENFNRCYHAQTKGLTYPITVKWKKAPTSNYTNIIPYRRDGFNSSPVSQIEHFQTDVRLASYRAWHTMRPKFQGQINLTQFVVELGDFKSAARDLLSIYNGHGLRLLEKFMHWVNKPGSSLDAASSAWLSWQLAIKPLLSDLYKISSQLMQSIDDAQKAFGDESVDGKTSHYTEYFQYDKSGLEAYPGVNGETWRQLGTLLKCKFTATAEMTWDYKLRSPMDAALTYVGAYGSFETGWELIPFSFVVDYFLKIGKAIKAMERDPNVSNVTAIKYCESIKTTHECGVFIDPSLNPTIEGAYVAGQPVTAPTMYSGYMSGLYWRWPSSPKTGLYVPLTGKLNATQGGTLAALFWSLLS